MTPDEFQALSPYDQETFLNEGGTISTPAKQPEVFCCDLPSGADGGKQVELLQAEGLGSLSPSSIPAGTLTQPALTSLGPPRSGDGLGQSSGNVHALSSGDMDGGLSNGVVEVNDSPIEKAPQTEGVPGAGETTQWAEGFDIKDPVELLFLLDDDIAEGRVKLHKWQVEFLLDFAKEGHTKEYPFKAAVQACNGSGKDKYVVASSVVWLCMRYSMARAVVTNGSGVQLDNQTETYIRHLCQRANAKFAGGKDLIWKCNYRFYECIPTRSPIVLFATDEPNKAEGYHPLKFGGKMAIVASEAKAIPDTIFAALIRCTGFTHRVDVSTPGPENGYFYERCTGAVPRREFTSIEKLDSGTVVLYLVTAFDCPHITPKEIKEFEEALPGGVNNPVYISGVLSRFSSNDTMVVIPHTFVWWAVKEAPKSIEWLKEPFNKAGLDLSDGGAETVLLVRNGNKHIKTLPFKFENTEDTLDYLEQMFKEYELTNRDAYIYADSCGIGKPMLNALRRRGWSNIRFVDSRNKAAEPKTYFNRGTELFFNVRKLLERRELIIQEDKVLVKQLSTRYYKINNKNCHQILTKLEQRSKGYPSPDRADAFNLAFWDYKSTRVRTDYQDYTPSLPYDKMEEEKDVPQFSLKQWAGDGETSLTTFQRNVSKRQPITHLLRELERYNKQN